MGRETHRPLNDAFRIITVSEELEGSWVIQNATSHSRTMACILQSPNKKGKGVVSTRCVGMRMNVSHQTPAKGTRGCGMETSVHWGLKSRGWDSARRLVSRSPADTRFGWSQETDFRRESCDTYFCTSAHRKLAYSIWWVGEARAVREKFPFPRALRIAAFPGSHKVSHPPPLKRLRSLIRRGG